MKKNLFTFVGAVAFIAATLPALAQTEQTRQVSGFKAISTSGSFNIHVKIDGTETVKIVADDDIINDITAVVEGGKLNIGYSKRQWTFKNHKVDIYVTARSLSSLSSSGSGNMELNGNLTGNTELRSSGSGHIKADVNGNTLQASVSGSGNITSAINAGEITASVSGSGKINLEGKVTKANVKVSGSGKINADGLKTDATDVSISGSGHVNISAEKTISGSVSGSGGVTYTGNATEVNVKRSGSGRIRKV